MTPPEWGHPLGGVPTKNPTWKQVDELSACYWQNFSSRDIPDRKAIMTNRKFTCKYCERTLTSDYRNGWEPEKPVCGSCMEEVRWLMREAREEFGWETA